MLEEDGRRNARNRGDDGRARLDVARLDEIEGGLNQGLPDPLPTDDTAVLGKRDINGESDNFHGNRPARVSVSKI